ncbi:MAG: Ig-like domain-containing protein [Paracoccaceae bacterium]|nr:Ig-like domain-containing protein [Paracoccaceae bacterium]
MVEDAAVGEIGNILTDPGGANNAVDSDPDGDTLTVTSVTVGGQTFSAGDEFTITSNTLGAEALATVQSDGSLILNDQGNFDALNTGDTDTVSFDYTIGDGNGGEDTANVVVTISGEDDVAPQTE